MSKVQVTEEDRQITVTDADGVAHTTTARIIKTDHGVNDADGNPKISVEIKVPSIKIGIKPGKVT